MSPRTLRAVASVRLTPRSRGPGAAGVAWCGVAERGGGSGESACLIAIAASITAGWRDLRVYREVILAIGCPPCSIRKNAVVTVYRKVG